MNLAVRVVLRVVAASACWAACFAGAGWWWAILAAFITARAVLDVVRNA